eukprot:1142368-Pelagomonas_calceolata.AAC.3
MWPKGMAPGGCRKQGDANLFWEAIHYARKWSGVQLVLGYLRAVRALKSTETLRAWILGSWGAPKMERGRKRGFKRRFQKEMLRAQVLGQGALGRFAGAQGLADGKGPHPALRRSTSKMTERKGFKAEPSKYPAPILIEHERKVKLFVPSQRHASMPSILLSHDKDMPPCTVDWHLYLDRAVVHTFSIAFNWQNQ